MLSEFNSPDWRPSASLEALQKRSQWLKQLRAFFYAREVMEVDTPMLSQYATPDRHLDSLKTAVRLPGQATMQTYYLHTSPEYPMKRLLCAGSGDIFYLGKVFRNGDLSPRHQVEFTMLEWYRLGFNMVEMMQEAAHVIQVVLGDLPIEAITYQQAFQKYANLANIHNATAADCRACLRAFNIPEVVGVEADDKALWEQLVLTEVIEPQLGLERITCLSHYPARDAALAQISTENPQEALRFEVFVQGMELANGYQELQDGEITHQRFQQSLQQRQADGVESVPLDERLLAGLTEASLPACSGVALGVDRLFHLALGANQLSEVMPFSIENA
ncbi:EF-P lysine aminoacylase GenX [Hydrogenovibrio sp. SC-1]|uniref:EF-P lysine aminoacylase EpmA n=1 Tax=Hydrogenovibrio sp. SC-1 TaxID=2065820 RepID=UPI000C7D307B|nr:EF-P lysine aminoacylase EpmA [Hydrogenovibrio sp. SC-1]PLA74144.1 EF-P lysine aminoacylase GenX [Hydrogenovibrio sp. SC-1]